MAIYHFTAKVISRSKGRSGVAAAAYRSGSQIHDYRQDLTFDYSAKPRVVHSEILAPEGARGGFKIASCSGTQSRQARKDVIRRSRAKSNSHCLKS